MRMSAEFYEQLPHALQRIEKMERPDAAAGTLCHTILHPQHDGRPVEPVNHPAGNNTRDSPVPAFAPEHQCRVIVRNRRLRTEFKDFADDGAFGRLPLFVEREQLAGDFGGFLITGSQEHAHRLTRAIHAPGRVDGGGDAKSHLGRVGDSLQPGLFEQRAQTGVAHIAQAVETVFDDDAVFTREGNDIRHSRDGDQFKK